MLAILNTFICAVMVLAVGNVVLSWFPRLRMHPVGLLIYRLSEPPLRVIRRMLSPFDLGGGKGMDLSPVVFFLLAQIVYILLRTLCHLAGIL